MGRKTKTLGQKRLEVLSARVNFELYERAKAHAESRDLTVTQVLRMAIKEFLENHKKAA